MSKQKRGSQFGIWHLNFVISLLPTAFGHARNQPLVGRFAEAYPAQAELSHIAVLSAATETPPHHARFKFRRSFGFCDLRFCRHVSNLKLKALLTRKINPS